MKKARYTDDQMVRILAEADSAPVARVAEKHGVSGGRSPPGGRSTASWR